MTLTAIDRMSMLVTPCHTKAQYTSNLRLEDLHSRGSAGYASVPLEDLCKTMNILLQRQGA